MIINNEISPAKDGVSERIAQESFIAPVNNPTAGVFVMRKCYRCGVDTVNITYCTPCKLIYDQKYKRTKHGHISQMYYNQKRRCIDKDLGSVEYSLDEFKEWLFSQERS